MLNFDEITDKIEKIVPKEAVFLYEQTDSTNTRALEYARGEGGFTDRAVFIANSQTSGRGRRGRSFVSRSDAGIFISLVFTPRSPEQIEGATGRAAVALLSAIKEVTGISAGIKWVNDIYAAPPSKKAKKLAGILAEAVTSDDGKISKIIVGMGINVYNSALVEEISDIATSIEEVSGKRFSREKIIGSLVEFFYKERERDSILEEYRKHSLTLGKSITVHPHTGESYPAFAEQILEDYSLLVSTESGEKRRIFSGEVTTRLD